MKLFYITSLIICFILLGWQLRGIKDYRLYKYVELDNILREMSDKEYDIENYNCLDFSKDAQLKLKEKGINSSIIIGENGSDYYHAYLGIWIDPINGEFVTDYKFNRVFK